jgi:hypothetical protein
MAAAFASVGAGVIAASNITGCDTKFVDECRTATGAFGARYEIQGTPTGTCDDATTAELTNLKGDIVGFQFYEEDHFHRDPYKDKNILAAQTNAMGTLAAAYASRKTADGGLAKDLAHPLYSLGTFTTAGPGPDYFCTVDTMAPAEQDLPAVPAVAPVKPADGGPADGGMDAMPAVSVSYAWANVRAYVDPYVSGAEVSAVLQYTKNGCTANYKVLAVYPYVPCLDKNKQPSDLMCDPVPHPEQGHPVGSGLKFPVRCDGTLGFCVLDKEDIP